MQELNHTLTRILNDADGTYLENPALHHLEEYAQTYSLRLETYQQLRDRSAPLIQQALRKMSQVHPEIIQKHGQRCLFDMTEVVRYMALSVLRDDEVFFKEQMLSWLDTILLAHKQNKHCAVAYRYLQETVQSTFPAAASNLIRPYFEIVIQVLQSHA